MNEDNVLVRNVLVEFEDSLKYVSNKLLGIFLVNDAEALLYIQTALHLLVRLPN